MAAPPLRIVPKTPHTVARIDPTERTWTNTRWGDLKASTLSSVIAKAERGEVGDWADLCEYAARSDGELASVQRTAIDAVVQAEWVVRPARDSWDPLLAELAAEFITHQLPRIAGFRGALDKLMGALHPGHAVGEMHYAYDRIRRVNYVEEIEHLHGHRFRYDEQKKLRLYDNGRRSTVNSVAGEYLDPHKFIIHEHMEVAGYPGASGIMAGCIWDWMFGRWVEKFRIGFQEKYGAPFPWAQVPHGTTAQVRDQIMEDLQNMASDHAAVFDKEVTLGSFEAATTSDEGYRNYLQDKRARYALAYLGASDITSPGENGSRNAVATRAAQTMDPRMVSRGNALAETLKRTLFRGLIKYNLHLFPPGTELADVPLPEFRLKSADDQVKDDPTGRATEIVDDEAAAGSEQTVVPDGPSSRTRPAAASEPADPKAPTPASQPGQMRRPASAPRRPTTSPRAATAATSTRSPSPFATALRRGSGA